MSEERAQKAIDPATGEIVEFKVRVLSRKDRVTLGKGGAIANPKRLADAKKKAKPKAES